MEKNDLLTNPIDFAQYVWERIEDGDTLIDRFCNIWEVSSYVVFDGRRIKINLRCIHNESCTGCNNGDYKKLTRYDLARKYYFYINNIAVKIPDVEDWDAGTFVQNYNLLWNIIDTMTPITKEETTDMYALFLLTQEADKIYEEKNEKISTIRTLNELKNKFEKRDYYDGDKIREKCVNCLPKEDKKMTENEKNYFLKNKGKTGVDTQLKSAFYSQEELDEVIKKIGDFLETQSKSAKNTCKESVKKFSDFSDEDLDRICTRVVDTFCNGVDKATDFSKKTLYDLKNWWRENHKDDEVKVKESKEESETKTETVKVNNNQSVVTVDNNDTDIGTHKVSSTDTEQPKPVFKLGDVVYTKGESVGYISRIGYTDRYCYYYWTPIIVSSNDKTFKHFMVNEERGLTYPYETHYKRIGNYLMSDLHCVKEMARIDSIYKLNEDNLKKFPYLDKYVNDFKDKENEENEGDTEDTIDFINRPFHIGDIVVDKNGNVGYISEICSRDNTWFYYYIPVVIKPNHITFEIQKPLDSTLENYIQIGAWDLTYSGARKNLSGFKEFKNLSLTYNKELPEELLKEFLDRNKESLSKKKTDEKDNNTSTTDNATSPSNRKVTSADSLPNYLSKLYLTDSAYSYEVNTKLTTDIVHKLNEVIEAIDDVILYNLNEIQEEERRRRLEERQNELKKSTLQSSEKIKNYSSVYNAVRKTAELWPSWKKEIYNNSFATSTHAKKL